MKSRSYPITIDDLSIDQVVDKIMDPSSFGVVVTPNADHMCRIYQVPAIRQLYEKAWLCICDSKIIQFLSFFSDQKIKNVVRGSDLTVQLLNNISKDEPVLVIGSEKKHANQIHESFGLNNVTCYVPPMNFIKSDEEVTKVHSFLTSNKEARIVFLAVGSPQQEIVATKYNDEHQDKVLICCGNAINFAVGNTKRAPEFMSKVGLEWLYRTFEEPKRMIPRYFSNTKIFTLFFLK